MIRVHLLRLELPLAYPDAERGGASVIDDGHFQIKQISTHRLFISEFFVVPELRRLIVKYYFVSSLDTLSLPGFGGASVRFVAAYQNGIERQQRFAGQETGRYVDRKRDRNHLFDNLQRFRGGRNVFLSQ